jgi:hypothetical protein
MKMAEVSTSDHSFDQSDHRSIANSPAGLNIGDVMKPGDKSTSFKSPERGSATKKYDGSSAERHDSSAADKQAQSWTDRVFGTLEIIKNDVGATLDSVNQSVKQVASEVEHQGKLLGEGVVTGAILNPINGVTELINHTTDLLDHNAGTHISELQFGNQQEVDNSIAGKIGETVGAIGDYAALSLATGGIAGAVGLTGIAADMVNFGVAGALSGGVFSPTGDSESNADFFEARAEGFAIGGVSGAVGAAAGGFLSGIAAPIENSVLRRSLAIGGGALLGGSTAAGSTELTALAFTGKQASLSDMLWSVGIGAFAGGVSAIPEDANVNIDEASERQPLWSTGAERSARRLAMPARISDRAGGGRRPAVRIQTAARAQSVARTQPVARSQPAVRTQITARTMASQDSGLVRSEDTSPAEFTQ